MQDYGPVTHVEQQILTAEFCDENIVTAKDIMRPGFAYFFICWCCLQSRDVVFDFRFSVRFSAGSGADNRGLLTPCPHCDQKKYPSIVCTQVSKYVHYLMIS